MKWNQKGLTVSDIRFGFFSDTYVDRDQTVSNLQMILEIIKMHEEPFKLWKSSKTPSNQLLCFNLFDCYRKYINISKDNTLPLRFESLMMLYVFWTQKVLNSFRDLNGAVMNLSNEEVTQNEWR